MNNTTFFDYLDNLIKEDKLAYAFRQIEHFLDAVELQNGAGITPKIQEIKVIYSIFENRYKRWHDSQYRVDSRDSNIEINQIVDGVLNNIALLKALPNINYSGHHEITEPILAEPLQLVRPKGRMKWYWWVAIVLGVFSASGVTYLLLHKEDVEKEEEKPIVVKKKALVLILHELGDRSSRLIDNQGRLSIRDMSNNGVAKDIGKEGITYFENVEDWVFEAKPFLVLDLQGLDERTYKYRLLDSLYDRFSRNDTVFIPFTREEIIVPEPNPVPTNNLNLYFYLAKTKTKKPFAFAKDETVGRLKDFIISKFVNKNDLRYGTETVLMLAKNNRNLLDETLTLSAAGIKEKDEVRLNIIVPVIAARTAEKNMHIKFKSQNFGKNAIVKVNNQAVVAEKNGNNLSINVPENLESEKYQISIVDGDNYYNYEVEKSDIKELTIDVNQMRRSSIKSISTERMRANQLKIKQ